MKVLVVDDDTYLLRQIRIQYEKLGVGNLLTSEIGHNALGLLETPAGPIDLILC